MASIEADMLFNPPDHPAAERFDMAARLDVLEQLGMAQSLDPTATVGRRTRIGPDPGAGAPELDSEEHLNFASNNFLDLAGDDRVQAAAKEAVENVGTGAGASRVAIGDTVAHRRLERTLAETKGTERALAFSSGYATNVGTLTALYPNVIFSDEYNHTSIVEASRMTDATVRSYDHCDVDDLAAQMAAQAEEGPTEKWVVVTESVFSMDGDVAPLADICDLADEYGAWVMVDEAHATGLYGNGGGVVQREGLSDRVEIQMGTLSKALAAQGGYVAGSEELISYLATTARSFLFSTGLAPPAAAAARRALEIAAESDRPKRLRENAAYLRSELDALGFDVWGSTHIVPAIIGDQSVCAEMSQRLRERGLLVHPVPYPGVPLGTSRIRTIPMATHTRAELDELVEGFETVGRELGVI
jgi:8-amino-7-oxononanoate synthase